MHVSDKNACHVDGPNAVGVAYNLKDTHHCIHALDQNKQMQQQQHELGLTLEQLAPVSLLPLHQTLHTSKGLWYISQQSNLSRQSATHMLIVSESRITTAPVQCGWTSLL